MEEEVQLLWARYYNLQQGLMKSRLLDLNCIQFVSAAEELKWSFIPTANTCSKTMFLIGGSHSLNLPVEEDLFDVFDTAFANNYFGIA